MSCKIPPAVQNYIDLVKSGSPRACPEQHALVERMESRHGLRQITYMKELGMGNDRYTLLDIDHGDALNVCLGETARNILLFGALFTLGILLG